ncbi:MAG: hypothetical protein GSR75_01980 [Desulfurococcales archaeon]|nr:hypothetical protein [Desulfurococcales archaeon]MEB3786860.1 hypothetical protein [Desulfurococcales archaeon]
MKLSVTITVEEIEPKLLDITCKSLEPEVGEEEKLSRGKVDLYCDNNRITIRLESDKLSNTEAMLSSYINLLKIIFDVHEANL